MIRFFDVIISIVILVLSLPLLFTVFILLYVDMKSPIFIQSRVGKGLKEFTLIKFRTMKMETPNVGTHSVSQSYLTKTGSFLRKYKIDELPQLLNVIRGDMSLVGPRPCLPSQSEVIRERLELSVFKVRPGITGLSQIQGIDMSTPSTLALSDKEMIDSFKIKTYFRLLFLTAIGKGNGDRIKIDK